MLSLMVESGVDGPKNLCNWKGLLAGKGEAFGGYAGLCIRN